VYTNEDIMVVADSPAFGDIQYGTLRKPIYGALPALQSGAAKQLVALAQTLQAKVFTLIPLPSPWLSGSRPSPSPTSSVVK
jgi:hypothetical protein